MSKPAWSARCDCYNNHPSSSGRCTCRFSGNDLKKNGVTDPTRNEGDVAICEECRANCPVDKGGRMEEVTDETLCETTPMEVLDPKHYDARGFHRTAPPPRHKDGCIQSH